MKITRILPATLLLTLLLPAASAAAPPRSSSGDWPGWRGPERTGLSSETGLLKMWPPEGPVLLWKATGLGHGYSTPSIHSGVIYLLGTAATQRDESLLALDARDGRILWSTPAGAVAGGKPGPRSTPTIDDGRAYVISSDGRLLCAELGGGRALWTVDLRTAFDGQPGGWAYAESPLIDGDRVLCTPGGESATIVALDKRDGRPLWKGVVRKEPGPGRKRPYATAGYSSIIAAEIDGVRQYIQFLDGGVVGFAAADGAPLWTYDRPACAVANCSTPIFHDGAVFAASSYRNGGGVARIRRAPSGFVAEEAWFLPEFLNHHGGVVLVDGHLYGTGASELFCVEFRTGTIAWRARTVGKGSVAYADGRIYLRSENGPMALVLANPRAYVECGRFAPADRSREKAWPHPVIAGGRLYLRDQDILQCYNIAVR